MNEKVTGRILKGIGGFYYVDTEIGEIVCRARGKLRRLGITPCAGDIAEISLQGDNTGALDGILERKNCLARPPIANIDMIAIVASKAAPETDTFFIDKLSTAAVRSKIDVCVVINKCDRDDAEELYRIYENAPVSVYRLSAKTGEGISAFRDALSGKLTAFTGNSGVGKSTLINSLLPQAMLKTGDINDKIGRGRHTTRQVEILKLEKDAWIADTPGFSAFDVGQESKISREQLTDLFPEFADFTKHCRFTGCAHIGDQGCAVIKAVENGEIERSRYDSYVRIFESIEDPKYK